MIINEVYKNAGIDLSQWVSKNLKSFMSCFSWGEWISNVIALTQLDINSIVQNSINWVRWYESKTEIYEQLNDYLLFSLTEWFSEIQTLFFQNESFIQLMNNSNNFLTVLNETTSRNKDFTKKESEDMNANSSENESSSSLNANSVNNFQNDNDIDTTEKIKLTQNINIAKLNKLENSKNNTNDTKTDRSLNYEDKENENVTHVNTLENVKFFNEFLTKNYENITQKLKLKLLNNLVNFYCWG